MVSSPSIEQAGLGRRTTRWQTRGGAGSACALEVGKNLLDYLGVFELNPQLNASTLVVLGLAHFLSGDFGEAIQAFQSAREINPEEMTNRLYLAAVLSRSGQEAEAQWEATEIAMLNPELSVDRWIMSQPYKDASELSRLRDDLHRAGLPE